jgi:hypothetical protein
MRTASRLFHAAKGLALLVGFVTVVLPLAVLGSALEKDDDE